LVRATKGIAQSAISEEENRYVEAAAVKMERKNCPVLRGIMVMNEKTKTPPSFEEAYMRLEEIVEELNSGKTPLEKSLNLYEEADHLMAHCTQKLDSAEQKIQMIMKNKTGEALLNEEGKPLLENYS
jgi:exodeoxyribonuclease VII small subunit